MLKASTLMLAKLVTGASAIIGGVTGVGGWRNFQTVGRVTATTGAATIAIEGTINGVDWFVLGNADLTLGITDTNKSFSTQIPCVAYRFNVTAISGTNASVDGYVC